MRLAIIALATVFACGGGRTQIEIKPPPPKQTTGALAGSLCQNGACACRTGADDAGYPEDGRKRFEIRLSSAYDLWLTMSDRVLYKSPEKAEGCFYIDLAPGKHDVQLRASNTNGVSFGLEIHELGTKTKDWYDTFQFKCGHPGVCSYADLDSKKAEYAGVKRGLHDACGSTKVKNVIWDYGKSPDQQYPSELAVQLTLDVYKFAPWKKHGDPKCGEGGGRGPDGEPTGEPSEPTAGEPESATSPP